MANLSSVVSYSPKDVQLIIAGYQVTGWQTISITRTNKGFTNIRGIRNKNTRLRNKDTSATITVSLMMTAQSNEVLSYIHELDLEQGTGRLVITLKDNSGKSVFSSNEAYITGYPAVTNSANIDYRNWEIFCQTTSTYLVAGNVRPTTSLFDGALNSLNNAISDIL